jgi:hypothetical protein
VKPVAIARWRTRPANDRSAPNGKELMEEVVARTSRERWRVIANQGSRASTE